MNRRILTTLLLAGGLLLSACQQKKKSDSDTPTRSIMRFEQVVFNTPAEALQQKLHEVQNDYNSTLLNIYPDNPEYMAQLMGFVADPVIGDIYQKADSTYADIQWLEEDLNSALDRAEDLCPSLYCRRIYTMVFGDFDYNRRVYCNEGDMMISLDIYSAPAFAMYRYFDMPMYLVRLCRPQYIVADCIAALVRNHIAMPQAEVPTMLDFMIMEGKTLYALDQILPKTHDTIRMRYTADQWDWMQHNEKNVWTYMIQNKMLYDNDYMRYHNFIEEAPQTNCFPGSAPRTGCYIGWKIVEQYMKKSHKTLPELLENSNSQQILSESGYRP